MMEFYTECLLSQKDILNYVLNRGITLDQINDGKIGYCPTHYNSPNILLNGRIIVPIYDQFNKLLALAGRHLDITMGESLKFISQKLAYDEKKLQLLVKKYRFAKWYNTSYPKKHILFNFNNAFEHIKNNDFCIITEGYFDSYILSNYGFPNVVSICGCYLSDYNAIKIKRYTNNVVLMLDGDDAGQKGIDSSTSILNKYNMNVFNIRLNCDPDELCFSLGDKLPNLFNKILEENLREVELNI